MSDDPCNYFGTGVCTCPQHPPVPRGQALDDLYADANRAWAAWLATLPRPVAAVVRLTLRAARPFSR